MQLQPSNYLQFITGGRAIFTVISLKTGKRFTYKVSIPKDKNPEQSAIFFVSVLTGSDNNSNYTYLGCIYKDAVINRHEFIRGRKSKIAADAPSLIAFDFVFNKIVATGRTSNTLEIWHEGKCCRCGRKLTVPSSIESGIGPECANIKEKNFA